MTASKSTHRRTSEPSEPPSQGLYPAALAAAEAANTALRAYDRQLDELQSELDAIPAEIAAADVDLDTLAILVLRREALRLAIANRTPHRAPLEDAVTKAHSEIRVQATAIRNLSWEIKRRRTLGHGIDEPLDRQTIREIYTRLVEVCGDDVRRWVDLDAVMCGYDGGGVPRHREGEVTIPLGGLAYRRERPGISKQKQVVYYGTTQPPRASKATLMIRMASIRFAPGARSHL